MILRTSGLTREFGGLTAVDDVDFELGADELCSLIGPNGAGKTTFFNLLTGTLAPTSGTIEFRPSGGGAATRGSGPLPDGGAVDSSGDAPDDTPANAGGASGPNAGSDGWVDITEAPVHRTATMGIHRSYQITNVFPHASVHENVRIAAQAHGGDSMRLWRNVNAFEAYHEEATAILERVGLAGKADSIAANLSHGEKRMLEIAIALAGDPDLLLLDEPNAGVSSEAVGEIIDLIEDVAEDHGVLLVEHNMDVVMEVSDRIVVLNQGAVIADGTPEAVRGDEAVQEAYLGGYERGELA